MIIFRKIINDIIVITSIFSPFNIYNNCNNEIKNKMLNIMKIINIRKIIIFYVIN